MTLCEARHGFGEAPTTAIRPADASRSRAAAASRIGMPSVGGDSGASTYLIERLSRASLIPAAPEDGRPPRVPRRDPSMRRLALVRTADRRGRDAASDDTGEDDDR